MQADILIPCVAAAICLQFSFLFLLLWVRHKDEQHLRTFSALTASLSVMILSALVLQKVAGPNAPTRGLLAYRIELVATCVTVSTLLRFSSRISNHALPIVLESNRLSAITTVLAGLAFTPAILHLPFPLTPIADYDEADRGPLFLPYVLLMVSGVSYAVLILWRTVRAPRLQPESWSYTGGTYFGDLRLLLIGVLLFYPAGIYEIVLAMGWVEQSSGVPIARSLSAVLFCGLTAGMLANGIFEHDRRKQRAEAQARAYLDTMSYAAHQVRGNIDNLLWLLRSSVKASQKHNTASPEQEAVKGAIDEANELIRIFNSMLLAARDYAGQALNLGPKRAGDLTQFVERLCRQRIGSACKAKGWDGSGDPPCVFRFCSELTQPLLYSRDALQHIIAILVDNAVKYSAERIEIEVRLWRDNGDVHIRVRDGGIGITPGYEELIFMPYSRGNAEERSIDVPGNGIGLPLARRLAESQGGTLRAESAGENLGSTFLLNLPAETEE